MWLPAVAATVTPRISVSKDETSSWWPAFGIGVAVGLVGVSVWYALQPRPVPPKKRAKRKRKK